MWDTGCALNEVTELKIKDIDKKKPRGTLHSKNANTKPRTFYLNDKVHKQLITFIKN